MSNNYAVKETICSKCIHLSICKHEDSLLELQQQIDDIISAYIFGATITCEYHVDKGKAYLNYKEGVR